jgi:hypothetical protein
MDFKLVSDNHRKIRINMELVDIYTMRYVVGTSYDVSITRRQKKVSDPMRRFYFAAVLPPLIIGLSYEKDEALLVHHQLKIRYFQNHPDFLDENGEPIIKQDERGIWRNVPSVFSNKSKLVISVKKEFVDWVIRIAAQYGIYIEDPGE